MILKRPWIPALTWADAPGDHTTSEYLRISTFQQCGHAHGKGEHRQA